eukprot:gene30895-37334_t
MSRAKEELLDLRKSIDKALQSDVPEAERISDIITILETFKVDLDLLKQTSMVQCLQSVKKQFAESDLGAKTKSLLLKWKKVCSGESTEDSQPTDDSKPTTTQKSVKTEERRAVKLIDSNKKVIPLPSASSAPSLKSSSAADEDEWDDGYMKNLHPVRQRVMKLLTDQLKLSAGDNENIASFAATNVEAAISNLYPVEKEQKAYLAKAQTLTYNLKMNDRLRSDVIDNIMPAHVLVTLSAKELATDAIKETREETTKSATLARRGDLYEITRSQILSANGIDPNKGGEFKCRKCKGTKTSHYALQTRSSDEPMTIFVCCLTSLELLLVVYDVATLDSSRTLSGGRTQENTSPSTQDLKA